MAGLFPAKKMENYWFPGSAKSSCQEQKLVQQGSLLLSESPAVWSKLGQVVRGARD